MANELRKAVSRELVFVIEDADEGGYTAQALGVSIFTEADTMIDDELREQIRDAVRCHFDEGEGPAVIRLHFVSQDHSTARKAHLVFVEKKYACSRALEPEPGMR